MIQVIPWSEKILQLGECRFEDEFLRSFSLDLLEVQPTKQSGWFFRMIHIKDSPSPTQGAKFGPTGLPGRSCWTWLAIKLPPCVHVQSSDPPKARMVRGMLL